MTTMGRNGFTSAIPVTEQRTVRNGNQPQASFHDPRSQLDRTREIHFGLWQEFYNRLRG